MRNSDRPSLFIGSSSEGLRVAEFVFKFLNAHCDAYLWRHGLFRPGNLALDDLERQLRDRHFAVIVGTADDVLVKHGQISSTIRDNLILEYGFFAGRLTRRRTYLLVPNNAELALPSDIHGITLARYDGARFERGGPDRDAALQAACMELQDAIEEQWQSYQSRREQRLRTSRAAQVAKISRLLYGVIAELRDLLAILSRDSVNTLPERAAFERVKREVAERLEKIAGPLRDQAASIGVADAYEDLIAATRAAIVSFPFPDEIFPTRDDARKTVVNFGVNLAQKAINRADVLAEFEESLGREVESRVKGVTGRYSDWWSTSHERIQSATHRLLDALMQAGVSVSLSIAVDDWE